MENDHIREATKKMRLIDANDVYALFAQNGMARLHVADIDAIPRVNAVEVVHGRWVRHWGHDECSKCGYKYSYLGGANYCPNCGADMRGDGNAID